MQRRRQGFAIGLVLVLAIVAGTVLVALSPLERTVARDLDSAQLEQEVLALAHSAADELALRFAQAANDPARGPFRTLRSPAGLLGVTAPGRWGGAQQVCDEVVAAGLPATQRLLDQATGEHRFDIRKFEISLDVEKIRGRPEPLHLTARVHFAATVRGSRGGKRTLERRVERVQGLRLSRLGMPWPFDSIGLFVQDGAALMPRAPGQAAEIAEAVTQMAADFSGQARSFSSEQLAPMQDGLSRLTRLAEFYRGPGHGLPWTQSSFFVRGEVDIQDGDTLGEAADEDIAKFRSARDGLQAALDRLARNMTDTQALEAVQPAFETFLKAGEGFRDRANKMLDRWVKVAHSSDVHAQAFDPGIESLSTEALWTASRWLQVKSFQELAGLFEAGARNGVVQLAAGSADLSDGSLWNDAKGRLVVLAPGAARVHDLSARGNQRLTTVVAKGHVTVDGTVEANIVALGGITLEANARIAGTVFVRGGQVVLRAGAQVRRDARTCRADETEAPVGATYHVAMDPFLNTQSVGGAHGEEI